MIVVADTTPLISLLKISHLDILQDLYGTVYIPTAVYRELTENLEFFHESNLIRNCPFLKIHAGVPSDKVDLLRRATGLDLGESEAIVLADSNDTKALLIDEAHGRKVAEHMGIPITGTIGVLAAAFRKGFFTSPTLSTVLCQMSKACSNRSCP